MPLARASNSGSATGSLPGPTRPADGVLDSRVSFDALPELSEDGLGGHALKVFDEFSQRFEFVRTGEMVEWA
jgi:hypothetical protein